VAISDSYPYDVGIENHVDVLVVSRFDTGEWYLEIDPDYENYFLARPYSSHDIDRCPYGHRLLRADHLENEHIPNTLYLLPGISEDEIYMRWYRRWSAGYDFGTQTKSNGFYADENDSTKPNGYNFYSCKLQFWDDGGSGAEAKFYTYNMDQPNPDFGETLAQNQGSPVSTLADTWNCYEIMIKANTVTGGASNGDGEIKLWINGVLKGSYTDMNFRKTTALKTDRIHISQWVGGVGTAPQDQQTFDAHMVVATSYIGPMAVATNHSTHYYVDTKAIVVGYNNRIACDVSYKDGAGGSVVHQTTFVFDVLTGDDAGDVLFTRAKGYRNRYNFDDTDSDTRDGSLSTTQTDPNGHLPNITLASDTDFDD
jgi:hypothetical protein